MLPSCFLRDYVSQVKPKLKKFIVNSTNDDGIILKVSSLYDYLKIMEVFENEHSMDRLNIDNQFFYRGISNKCWKLEPSLAFRNLVPYESNMVEELKQLRPDEFENIDSDFNLLSKMQHYGLPTRLLDFSCNPLVALYFACCDTVYDDVDGRVFMTLENTFEPSLRKCVESPCSTYNNLWESVRRDVRFRHEYLSVFYGSDNNLFFLKPNYITERERRQESVFLIFPNHLYDLSKSEIVNFERGVLWELGVSDIRIDVDNLVVHASIMPIPKTSFSKNFVCIDIGMQYKSSIIKQLAAIGINESFLFPELEYAAKMLRTKYEGWNNKLANGQFSSRYER